jgi:hypothetical protein
MNAWLPGNGNMPIDLVCLSHLNVVLLVKKDFGK